MDSPVVLGWTTLLLSLVFIPPVSEETKSALLFWLVSTLVEPVLE